MRRWLLTLPFLLLAGCAGLHAPSRDVEEAASPSVARDPADPQVAFAHYLCHCGGTGPDGQPHSSWMRVSAGYRKHGDGWK
ncbi:hypothetical protein VST49_33460, partial [Pseudomonas aeruginosa]